MTAFMAKAWAYCGPDGAINIKTVADTELAAQVNAIVVLSEGRVLPLKVWSDEKVRAMYKHVAQGAGAIVPVRVISEALVQ